MKGSNADEVLAALEAAKAEHPDLVLFLDFRRDLLLAQSTAVASSLSFDATTVRTRLQADQPVLTLDDLALDETIFTDLLRQVDEVMRRYQGNWPTALPDLAPNAVRAWYAQEEIHDEQAAFLIAEAMRPFLIQAAKMVRPHLDGIEWYRQYCPACGGAPDFATLERESGARLLFCSRCDTGWRYKRIGCSFCDTEDLRMAYYPSDDGVYRLYVCDACRRYLKVVDLRQTRRALMLPVERVLTVDMDLAAREAGYT